MKERLRLIVVLIMVSMFAAGAAFAAEAAKTSDVKDRANPPKERKAAIVRQLNLTPDQEKRLNDAKAMHRMEMTDLAQQLKDKRQELKNALANPAATNRSVKPIATQVKTLEAQMIDLRIDGILKIKEILTPEQYQKLQSMEQGRQNRAPRKSLGGLRQ